MARMLGDFWKSNRLQTSSEGRGRKAFFFFFFFFQPAHPLSGRNQPASGISAVAAYHSLRCMFRSDGTDNKGLLSDFALGAVFPMQSPHDGNSPRFIAPTKDRIVIQVMISARISFVLIPRAFIMGLTVHID